MATQVVELTGDEAALLRSLDRAVKKQLEYEAKLRDTGTTGDAAGTQVEAALARVERESNKALRGLMAELKSLGPEGARAAGELQSHFVETGKAGYRSFDAILDKIRAIDPTAADAAAAARESLDDSATKATAAFNETLQLLAQLGPEGASAARKIKQDMDAAAAESAGGFDALLNKLAELKPEAATSAEAIRQQLNAAANDVEGQMRNILDEMRALGPEGRKAADEIKKQFVEAGHISERSMEDVARALEAINPEAAKAANAVIANMKRAGDESQDPFRKFSMAAIAEISSIAGAYIGIQEAVQLVNDYLEQQREIVREIATAQTELAKAQETASKNLAGLTKIDRLGLLNEAPKIAAEVGVKPAIVTQALGEVASTGLNDPEQIANIVTQAAKLTRLTPEELPSAAAGAADIKAKTGLGDIRQTVSLFLTTGAQSLVADPAKLQAALPRALGAGIVSAPNQNPEEAARETAAIFAQATNVGTDTQGSSSATFTIDLLNRMDKFFTGIERERIEARSKIELIDRKIEKGKDTELDRTKKAELEKFLAAAGDVKDPGTQFGRLAILQSSPDIAAQFTGPAGFGEKQFAPYLKEMLDPNSKTAKAIRASKEGINADVQSFENQAKELVSSTPAISGAVFESETKALLEATQLQKEDQAMLGKIRQTTEEVMRATNPGGVAGFFDSASDFLSRSYGGNVGNIGSNASDAALQSLQYLLSRRSVLQSDGLQGDDVKNIALLNATIERLLAFIERDSGALNPNSAAITAQRANALARDYATPAEFIESFDRLAKILERIASGTDKTAENTGKVPSVTPALSSSQP